MEESMKKNKVEKIEMEQFSKPDEIEDIEVIVGDSSVLDISEVGDYINTVKNQPGESATPSIIIPKEKLSKKQKIKPKISKEANSDEIKIPKNVKKAKKHHDDDSSKIKKDKIKKKEKHLEHSSTETTEIIEKKKKKKKTL